MSQLRNGLIVSNHNYRENLRQIQTLENILTKIYELFDIYFSTFLL
jgi:hypothetical protein